VTLVLIGVAGVGKSTVFMPVSLLESQLATLEPLEPDEPGVTVSAAGAPDDVVEEVLADMPSAA
jgi:gluconate kinase